jgi:AbiV family abortive infection protein
MKRLDDFEAGSGALPVQLSSAPSYVRNNRRLPPLSAEQVVKLQDGLLANANRLLESALTILDGGQVALARSLAILGMEESGKAIALHERRVMIAYESEGASFVTEALEALWSSHPEKLKKVHEFLVEEKYWFGTEASDPEANAAALGAIRRWTQRHDSIKQRGFYVDIDGIGNPLEPTGVGDVETVRAVISHVHQIGWQLRLGEHIEAKAQAQAEEEIPAADEAEIEEMRSTLKSLEPDMRERMLCNMRIAQPGRKLANDAYRLKLPSEKTNPLAKMGRPGYEAETRELLNLAAEIDHQTGK